MKSSFSAFKFCCVLFHLILCLACKNVTATKSQRNEQLITNQIDEIDVAEPVKNDDSKHFINIQTEQNNPELVDSDEQKNGKEQKSSAHGRALERRGKGELRRVLKHNRFTVDKALRHGNNANHLSRERIINDKAPLDVAAGNQDEKQDKSVPGIKDETVETNLKTEEISNNEEVDKPKPVKMSALNGHVNDIKVKNKHLNEGSKFVNGTQKDKTEFHSKIITPVQKEYDDEGVLSDKNKEKSKDDKKNKYKQNVVNNLNGKHRNTKITENKIVVEGKAEKPPKIMNHGRDKYVLKMKSNENHHPNSFEHRLDLPMHDKFLTEQMNKLHQSLGSRNSLHKPFSHLYPIERTYQRLIGKESNRDGKITAEKIKGHSEPEDIENDLNEMEDSGNDPLDSIESRDDSMDSDLNRGVKIHKPNNLNIAENNANIADNRSQSEGQDSLLENTDDYEKQPKDKGQHFFMSKNVDANEEFGKETRKERDVQKSHSRDETYGKGSSHRFKSVESDHQWNNRVKDDYFDGPEDADSGKIEPQYHRRLHINENDNYSYKSPASDTSEGEPSNEELDKGQESKSMFARREQYSKYRDESPSQETCIGYKAEEKVSTVPSTACSSTTPLSTTKQCANNGNKNLTNKTTATPKSLKPVQKPSDGNSSSQELEEYDKFLCGQLVDDFVLAVMSKIKKSPKIRKELGFNNDTDETCERCIETKPSNIPDVETLKCSLGKCTKNHSSKSNCFRCYSVPKPMDKFLSSLVFKGKEYDSNSYSNGGDESSFIFTGDSNTDRLVRTDNGVNDGKNTQDAFVQDIEKNTGFRDELNIEKHKGGNSNEYEESKTDLNKSDSTKLDENETEDDLQSSKKKLSQGSNEYGREKALLRTDASYKDSELDEEFNPLMSVRNKYTNYKDTDVSSSNDLIGSGEIIRRRKAYKSSSGNQPNSPFNLPGGQGIGADSAGLYNEDPGFSFRGTNNKINMQPQLFGDNLPPLQRSGLTGGNNPNNHFVDYTGDNLYKNQYFSKFKQDDLLDKTKPRSFQGPTHYGDSVNSRRSESNMDIDGWVNNYDEYQLIPNQNSQSSNIGSKEQKYRNRYGDGSLRMDKREVDPMDEDETIYFEIPDVEYDLY